MSREREPYRHVFDLGTIVPTHRLVTLLYPSNANSVNQSKPAEVEKVVVRNWCETMQASGVSYRLCRASFSVRASAHLRCAETTNEHARLNLVTFS